MAPSKTQKNPAEGGGERVAREGETAFVTTAEAEASAMVEKMTIIAENKHPS